MAYFQPLQKQRPAATGRHNQEFVANIGQHLINHTDVIILVDTVWAVSYVANGGNDQRQLLKADSFQI